ncbi:MAG: HAD-IIB family hydrolase [Zestosphaera sp.]
MVDRIGLFFDYDGVLAPIVSTPDGGDPDLRLMETLRKLMNKYKVAVVSGRDCWFLLKRVPDLHGYACVYGMEILAGNYAVVDKNVYLGVKSKTLEDLASKFVTLLNGRVGVIVGKTLQGIPLGISVYWSLSDGMPKELNAILEEARASGLVVYPVMRWGDYAEFTDIHVSRRSKDEAIRVLKTLLGISKVIYFGDSSNDIPAFREADVRVLVRHEYNSGLRVEADHVVNAAELAEWLLQQVPHLEHRV